MVIYQHLRELAQRADYPALAQAAELVAREPEYSTVDRALASLLWGYALLRIDPTQNSERAFDLATPAAESLRANARRHPDASVWAQLVWAFMLQFAGRDPEAERVLRALIADEEIPLNHRLVAWANLAHSLTNQGHSEEAAQTLQAAAEAIDALPHDRRTTGIRRERERIRLNLADFYLSLPDVDAAETTLSPLDESQLTPLMATSLQVSRARIAMMRDNWDLAESLAQEAHTVAIEVGFQLLRIDALGVLVAAAGRRGRTAELRRLAIEMAALSACNS